LAKKVLKMEDEVITRHNRMYRFVEKKSIEPQVMMSNGFVFYLFLDILN